MLLPACRDARRDERRHRELSRIQRGSINPTEPTLVTLTDALGADLWLVDRILRLSELHAVAIRLSGLKTDREPTWTMSDEPRLEIIKLPDLLGAEWRAERARQREEARRRYRDHVTATLAAIDASRANSTTVADAIIDALFGVTRAEGDGPCSCSCHPRLSDTDLHDYGFECSCQLTAAERSGSFSRWMADMDEFWESPEGQDLEAARAEEERVLRAWLEENPDVTVTSHGGMAPEQWYGTVDGRSFYFRERHDHWRIELDVRPSGRFYRAWVAGDLDDDASYEQREVEEGDVIAEGATTADGYGRTPAERARFIIDTIRARLGREDCDVHRHELDDLECLFGRPLNWCPACGLKLYTDRPNPW